jgi:Xaa-Pro aminopeptidase
MDTASQELLAAQIKAEDLFAEIVACNMVSAGKLESELTAEIHALAQSRFGVRRHWHKRIARSGPNTLLTYHDPDSDRRIGNDDIVYLDLGPVFEAWEADFGRTYVWDPIQTSIAWSATWPMRSIVARISTSSPQT